MAARLVVRVPVRLRSRDERMIVGHTSSGGGLRADAVCVAARAGDRTGSASRLQGRVQMGDVLGRLHRPASQSADADHARQRQPSRRPMDLPGQSSGPAAGVAAHLRRRHLYDRPQRLGLGHRRAHRPSDLALSAHAAKRRPVLRQHQSRLRDARRSPVQGHARRAHRRAQHEDRRDSVGHADGRLSPGLQRDRRAASS